MSVNISNMVCKTENSATSATDDRPVESGISQPRRPKRRLLVMPAMSIDELMQAARHLGDHDRALIEAVYTRGLPMKAVAAMLRRSPNRVYRRVHLVLRRMRSPLFRLVLRKRLEWPEPRRSIADMWVMQGESQRSIAQRLNTSLHRVRVEVERLKALAGEGREAAQLD